MAKKTQGTEAPQAPDTATATVTAPPVVSAPHYQPRQKRIERQGSRSEPYTIRYPEVRGGICEFCGTLDPNYGFDQYKLCPHYRGMELRCSYCDSARNPEEVVRGSVLRVAQHPNDPDSLVVWCDSYDCSRKHEKRFKVA